MSWELDGLLLDAVAELGVAFERVEQAAYLVSVRNRHVWLIAGEQDVAVEAFVLHAGPGVEALHRYLLFRNRLLRRVHFCTDEVGDVFLTGALPLADVTTVGLDRLLGEVWQVLGDDLDRLLHLAHGPDVPAKALLDGAGRRLAGTPASAPRRDARR